MRVCVPEDANQPLAAAAFYPALAHASQHRMRQREIGYRAERRVTACRRAKAYRKRISENIMACDENKMKAHNSISSVRCGRLPTGGTTESSSAIENYI